jgi:4a-hydroxytetrahydrobiopterin dehydratase
VKAPARLDPAEADRALASSPWRREGDHLVLEVEFGTFAAAIAFVDEVAALAETHDHHPDIEVRFRRVRLSVTTHQIGGLSARDLELAAAVAAL